ncbi:MAG: acyl-CoA thioesterase [Deltaproteobacteria bacterium]|nr:acyl-CoA thioesterase [Deltaproteobacteria bacterium]
MAVFRSVQRVYFDDLDALNILHNVRYLLFIERARGELFQSAGFRWNDDLQQNPDKWHVIAAHEIHYLRPVTGEQEIAVLTNVTKIGTTSLLLDARVTSTNGDVVYATNATRLVRLDPATNKPCPWSDRFRSAMQPYMK